MESPFCAGSNIRDDADFRLIETFGCHAGEGVRYAALHLARLARSAAHFGISYDAAALRARLDALEPPAAGSVLRCRLTMDVEGRFDVSSALVEIQARPWVVDIAQERLQAQDPWLQHKTTRRALYDRVRAGVSDGVDEVLFFNERDELCEGTITSVFVRLQNGEMVTPPLSSGVLPGVLRQSLLQEGLVKERVVTLQDLQKAQGVRVGNSLRGQIAVTFRDGCHVSLDPLNEE